MLRTWHDHTGKGISFFTSPWDCVKTFQYVDPWYTRFENLGVRICEYDILDDIIASSWRGDGYYNGVSIPEIKIPLEFLFKNSETTLSEK